MTRVTPGTGSAATPGRRSAAVSGRCRSVSFPCRDSRFTAYSRRRPLSPALRAPDTGQLPGRMGPGIPGAGGAAVPVLPHPAAQVRRRAGIQGVVPAPEHIDIVHSLTSLPPAYHDPPPGATVTPGIVVKFDEFQGVQVAAGGEVPLPQHQIVRAHGLQDALLPHQAVRAHQEAGGRAAANVPASRSRRSRRRSQRRYVCSWRTSRIQIPCRFSGAGTPSYAGADECVSECIAQWAKLALVDASHGTKGKNIHMDGRKSRIPVDKNRICSNFEHGTLPVNANQTALLKEY